MLDANHFVDVDFLPLEESEIAYTSDTMRPLSYGEELFFNEETGEYYDSWLAMIRDAWYKGMTKQELVEALDVESLDGYLYYTSVEGKC